MLYFSMQDRRTNEIVDMLDLAPLDRRALRDLDLDILGLKDVTELIRLVAIKKITTYMCLYV